MRGTVRARVKQGNLELLEKIDLPEGKEVTVTVLDVPSRTDYDAFDRSAGAWKNKIDAAKLIKNTYADRGVSTRRKVPSMNQKSRTYVSSRRRISPK